MTSYKNAVATARLDFDIGIKTYVKIIVVMKDLTGPNIDLHFMRHNCIVIDTTHFHRRFSHLTRLVKSTVNETSAKLHFVLTDGSPKRPPRTTKTITAFVDHPLERNTTWIVTPLEKLTERAGLLMFHTMSTKIDKK